MYNRFRGCGCMHSYNNQVIEDVCDNYTNDTDNNCNCCDSCSMNQEACECGFYEEYNVHNNLVYIHSKMLLVLNFHS